MNCTHGVQRPCARCRCLASEIDPSHHRIELMEAHAAAAAEGERRDCNLHMFDACQRARAEGRREVLEWVAGEVSELLDDLRTRLTEEGL